MVRFFGYFLVLAMACIAGCGENPKILFVSPTHCERGVLDVGQEQLVGEFEIFNNTDTPIRVRDLYPSCSCAEVSISRNPIPANGTAKLTATANISAEAGVKKFTVFAITDNVQFPRFTVSFSGILPASGKRDENFNLGEVLAGTPIDITIPFQRVTNCDIDLADPGVVSNRRPGDREALLNAELLGEGADKRLRVTGVAPKSEGAFSSHVMLREFFTDQDLGETLLDLRIIGNVVPLWDVDEDLYLGFIKLDQDLVKLPMEIKLKQTALYAATGKVVETVDFAVDCDWLSIQQDSLEIRKPGQPLKFQAIVATQAVKVTGPLSCDAVIHIRYRDGQSEKYHTNINAHFQW